MMTNAVIGGRGPSLRRNAARIAVGALLAGAVSAPAAAVAAEDPDVPTEAVVSTASTWRYLDDASDPAAGSASLQSWTATGFDDSAWKQASGSFGARNGKLEPIGSHTPTVLLNHYTDGLSAPTVPTYFFRTTFDLQPGVADEVGGIVGDLVFDDAVQVWINGEKVAGYLDDRVTGTSNQVYAGASKGDASEETFTADGDVLVDGVNTIAIALFQDRETSSDIYLSVPSIRLVPESSPDDLVPQAPSRVILTPTGTPSTSQSFSWLEGHASHTSGAVQIRPVAGGDVRTVPAYEAGAVNNNPLMHYSVTVDGLTPGTDYTYRVGLEGAWSPWHTFTTADPSDRDFQFIYYGDAQIGLDSTWPSVVAQAEEKAVDSIGSVHAGDLIDTASNETQWVNWFTGMEHSAATTNVMAAPGNHEYSGDRLLTAWKANFEYPHNNPSVETVGALADLAVGDSDAARQYAAFFAHWTEFAQETVYYTDYQGVRFITINATRDRTFLTPADLPECTGEDCPSANLADLWVQFQAAWLDHVLENSPSKWNVVTFHQPVYSTSQGRDEPQLRAHWVPVFQKHDIDLVMMGHDHTYARGYNNEDVTETAGITDGPVYIVSNSGAKHYSLATPEKNVWTNNGATQVLRGQGVTTYQIIDVTADSLVYRSYLAEKTAAATTDVEVGEVYDEFTITKTDDGRKWVTEAGVAAPVEPTVPAEPTEPAEPQVPAEPTDPGTPDAVGPMPDADLAEAARGDVSAPASAAPGERITVRTGEADTEVRVWLHSAPRLLTTTSTDALGALSVVIPADTTPGAHRLVVQSADGTLIGWAPITVEAAEAPSAVLAATGVGSSVVIAWLGAGMLAVGVLVVIVAVRRRAGGIS